MATDENMIDLSSLTDEEWKRHIGKPEFMPAADSSIIGITEDKEGNIWAFLGGWTNWAYLPYAVSLRINKKSIEVAARAGWCDEPFPPLQEGDLPIFGGKEWEKMTGLSWPSVKAYCAVKLPFKPTEITLFDK